MCHFLCTDKNRWEILFTGCVIPCVKSCRESTVLTLFVVFQEIDNMFASLVRILRHYDRIIWHQTVKVSSGYTGLVLSYSCSGNEKGSKWILYTVIDESCECSIWQLLRFMPWRPWGEYERGSWSNRKTWWNMRMEHEWNVKDWGRESGRE